MKPPIHTPFLLLLAWPVFLDGKGGNPTHKKIIKCRDGAKQLKTSIHFKKETKKNNLFVRGYEYFVKPSKLHSDIEKSMFVLKNNQFILVVFVWGRNAIRKDYSRCLLCHTNENM